MVVLDKQNDGKKQPAHRKRSFCVSSLARCDGFDCLQVNMLLTEKDIYYGNLDCGLYQGWHW